MDNRYIRECGTATLNLANGLFYAKRKYLLGTTIIKSDHDHRFCKLCESIILFFYNPLSKIMYGFIENVAVKSAHFHKFKKVYFSDEKCTAT